MGDYKDLNVWKISIDLVKDIYQLTSKFPSEEKFGLIAQIRRAAVSIPSNIAEGANRNSSRNIQKTWVYTKHLNYRQSYRYPAYDSRIGYLFEKEITCFTSRVTRH